MSYSLLNTIYLALAFLVLFASSELLYHKFKVKAEITRKYVHFSTGILSMLFPPLIGNHWLVLLLCGSFLIILFISLRFKKLPSINAIVRVTRGSILYPIIVYCCYLVFMYYNQFIFYYIPILILAICDPIAALVGKKFPLGKYATFGHMKTLSGSVGFFIAAMLTCTVLILGLEQIHFVQVIVVAIFISLATSFAEAISHRGYDNLTIPFSALLVLVVFKEFFIA
ncbi:MAG: hypothetical protein OEW67_11685 [Cyclobacteriaceae bacterium]|nr:hypothetical protein [Cyclobacteriaceae bacterium]